MTKSPETQVEAHSEHCECKQCCQRFYAQPDNRSWLVAQLEAWPTRVDPEKTTNLEYLMKSAAAALSARQTGDGTRSALEQAIADYMAAAGVPLTEFDPSFVTRMVSAMMVSFHKYGRVADAYPLKFSAADDVRARMSKYRQTGNKHFLVDAANFAMIEAMHPAPERTAYWGSNDAADSPGRTTASGHRLVQEDNDGNRIMGETILHHPSELNPGASK